MNGLKTPLVSAIEPGKWVTLMSVLTSMPNDGLALLSGSPAKSAVAVAIWSYTCDP